MMFGGAIVVRVSRINVSLFSPEADFGVAGEVAEEMLFVRGILKDVHSEMGIIPLRFLKASSCQSIDYQLAK